jgi:hypothetical protein
MHFVNLSPDEERFYGPWKSGAGLLRIQQNTDLADLHFTEDCKASISLSSAIVA